MLTKKGTVRTVDMTEGDPIRLILAFALPLLLGNVFQQIYTMVDTVAVGYLLGDEAISAIGATSAVYSLMITFANGLNSGFAIVVTQAFGSHDRDKLRRSVAGIFILNGISTLILTVLSISLLIPLLRFMNTPEGIFSDAYSYISVLYIGIFSTVGYNMFSGLLRAVGDSKTPLYNLIVASVANIVLDVPLVLLMGVPGAALATVISQTVAAVLGGISFFRQCRDMIPKREELRISASLLSELISSGIAMALMMCVVSLGSVIFQRANNLLGEDIIAAHSTSHKIFTVCLQPISAMSAALSTFVSQNYGAGRYERIRFSLGRILILQAIWGVLSCISVYLTGGALVHLLTATENEYIVSNAVMSMRICLPFFPVLGALQCLRTAMQSMGYKTAPVISSCIEVLVKIIGAAFIIPAYGYLGSCVTEPLTWTVMAAFLALSYLILRKKIYKMHAD
jgi:Na+-driven multidrug efflux pump